MTVYILLTLIIFMLIIGDAFDRDRMRNSSFAELNKMQILFEEERKAWKKERTELIDRIQYPTVDYATFKAINKEKVEKPPEEKKPKPELV